MTNSELIIQNWGSGVEYQSAWDRQRELHHKIVTENHPDVAVLLEHQNVYTAGRSTKPEDRPTDSSPVFDIDRGGRITWHGPGQIVCYPIMKLDDPVDVVAHVRRLELLIMNVCSKLGLKTTQIEGRSGVWVIGKGLPDKKIGGIGDADVTTISLELGRDVSVAEVTPLIEEELRNGALKRNVSKRSKVEV